MPETMPPVRSVTMITWIFALIVGTIGSAATAVEPARVLVEDAFSPWSDRNGAGLANELVRAAFGAVNIEVNMTVVPYARCRALVIQGSAPSCFSMSPASDLLNAVRFSDKPLFSVTAHAYVAKARRLKLRSLDDLRRGMRVGIVNGYEYPQGIAELAGRGIILERNRSETANLRKLASNRLDVALVLADHFRSAELVERQSGATDIVRAFIGPTQSSFIGFSVLNRDGEHQRALFNAGYRIIAENGQKASIEARWRLHCARFCPE